MGHTFQGPRYVEGSLLEGPRGSTLTDSASRPSAGFQPTPPSQTSQRLSRGGFYVKENNSHGNSKLCLSPLAAALVPEELLQTPHGVSAWKAIIQQLEDQRTEGATEPEAVATQATGLSEFVLRVQQTPYAITPMRPRHRHRARSKEEEVSASMDKEGTHAIF